MPPQRKPKTLRLTDTAKQRDKVILLVDGEETTYEVKLPVEIDLGNYEELQRVMDGWSAIDQEAEENRLPHAIRFIRRMIDIFFYDKVPREAVDALNWDDMEKLAAFLEERYIALTPTQTVTGRAARRPPTQSG